MPEPQQAGPVRRALARWGGAAVVAGSIGFIGERLWRLEPGQLADQASWPLAGAMAIAPLLFAGADHLLARGWQVLADPQQQLDRRVAGAIYGRGVLMKYLPGSVFQYVSRQFGGAEAGLAHGQLAKASLTEVGLHLASSMTVAAACLIGTRAPLAAGAGLAALTALCWGARRPLLRALACQIGAFSAFAMAAMVVGAVLLPASASLPQFGALFLLAWLAGFVVPVAPGGLGVREAALLALAGPNQPAAALLGAVLALRIASVLGDLGYGLAATMRGAKSLRSR
ncbi:hypothetical protein [Novosphingobium sp. B 225]|uniref:hypothetical protein n=1 Tax=Novosphingobium sp. B 225 TaxID=1961849 RepID=UPI000B4BB6FA|nr:hypothetical protein [Novosphingobium sp. B 225]